MNQLQGLTTLLDKTPDSVKQFHSKMYLEKIGQLERDWKEKQETIKPILNEMQAIEDEKGFYAALLKQIEAAHPSELIDVTPTKEEVLATIMQHSKKSANGHEILLGNQPYDPKLSLSKKLQFVLSLGERKELDTRIMCERIIEVEPTVLQRYNDKFDTLQKAVGSTLLQKIQNKTIFYRVPLPLEADQKQIRYAYGLRAWGVPAAATDNTAKTDKENA